MSSTSEDYPGGSILHTFIGKEKVRIADESAWTQQPYLNFGARLYDAATGHFLSTDPLAEKYFGINPYIYCAGDPVNSLDPNGEFIDTILDVYSIGVDIKDIATSIKAGDVKGALVSGATLVYDVVAAAIPGVPAVGFAKSAVKTADKAVDAAKASGKATHAVKEGKEATKAPVIYIAPENKIDRTLLNPPTKEGRAPTFKADNKKVEIHHVGQNPDGPYVEMHPKDHRGQGNMKINHPNGKSSI